MQITSTRPYDAYVVSLNRTRALVRPRAEEARDRERPARQLAPRVEPKPMGWQPHKGNLVNVRV